MEDTSPVPGSDDVFEAAREMERRQRDDQIADELDQAARAADALPDRRDEPTSP